MNEKERAALVSIAASAGLTVAKAAIGLLTGSLAILSEAGHSLIDLAATVLTYFAVRISGKPETNLVICRTLLFRSIRMLPAVILRLVPRIQPPACSGASGWLDGRDKPDHDNPVPST